MGNADMKCMSPPLEAVILSCSEVLEFKVQHESTDALGKFLETMQSSQQHVHASALIAAEATSVLSRRGMPCTEVSDEL